MVVPCAAAVLAHLLVRILIVVAVVTGARCVAPVEAIVAVLACAVAVGAETMVAAVVLAIVCAKLLCVGRAGMNKDAE